MSWFRSNRRCDFCLDAQTGQYVRVQTLTLWHELARSKQRTWKIPEPSFKSNWEININSGNKEKDLKTESESEQLPVLNLVLRPSHRNRCGIFFEVERWNIFFFGFISLLSVWLWSWYEPADSMKSLKPVLFLLHTHRWLVILTEWSHENFHVFWMCFRCFIQKSTHDTNTFFPTSCTPWSKN